MIVCFIFKIDQPLLGLSVDLNGNDDGAGVDLVCLLLILQKAVLLQFSGSHRRQVHQADELVLPVAVHIQAVLKISPEGCLDRLTVVSLIEGHVLQFRGEGGVTAVI